MDTLHPVRKYALIPAIAYAIVAYQKPVLFWIICVGGACIASIYVLKAVAVRRAQVPQIYRRASAIEMSIVLAGVLLFLAVGLWPVYGA